MDIRSSSENQAELHLAIAATFTAEPIEKPLSFLLDLLGFSHTITFSPYNQVFQQLLDPNSLFAQNRSAGSNRALNIIFIRLSDWLESAPQCATGDIPSKTNGHHKNESGHTSDLLSQNADDLTKALKQAALKDAADHLLVFCPPPKSLDPASNRARLLSDTETLLVAQLQQVNGLEVITHQQVMDGYPVVTYDDEHTARAGHVPYTTPFYAALAALAVRRYSTVLRSPHKVIVLDCDNTLWQGVCGEEGPTGVKVTQPYSALQRFMLEQQKAGMLLCLASKNVKSDVDAVFEQNDGMLLKKDDIVATRINWQPKSENIRSLAEELNLGPDSFIFIDDNPIECAEVRAACPDVATLQLPHNPEEIPHFLNHVWVFDKLNVTDEDKLRAIRYRQNTKREQAKHASTSLKDFLESLALSIDISAPVENQSSRIAQLTQRTNQFNSTTIRRNETEISGLVHGGNVHAAVVKVSDRFGDYGLVGVMIYAFTDTSVQVDTFILSCRALGRGVEQTMTRFLAEEAKKKDLKIIEIAFSRTERNEPVHAFLETVAPYNKSSYGHGMAYGYRIEDLLSLVPLEAATPSIASTSTSKASGTGTKRPAGAKALASSHSEEAFSWQTIASELNTAERIHQYVSNLKAKRPALQTSYIEPQTEVEKKVAQIWQDILGIDQVGTEDGFTELGGTSLQLVQIYGQLLARFEIELPFTKLFALPTIRAFTDYLNSTSDGNAEKEDQAKAIQQRAALQKAAMQQRKKLQLNLK